MNNQDLESQIRKAVERLFSGAELRYRVRHGKGPHGGPDLIVDLDVGNAVPVALHVALCANPRFAQVMHKAALARGLALQTGAAPVVAVPRLSAALRDALRKEQVGYISLDGQAHIRARAVLIDRHNPEEPDLAPQQDREPNPFADKSSLILRYLLGCRAAPVAVRDVAKRLGVSAGLVSRIESRLRRDGFLVQDGGEGRIADRVALLEDWKEFYKRRARRQREVRLYLHARNARAVMDHLAGVSRGSDPPHWALSFQAGASLVAPHAFFSEVHVLIGGMPWADGVEEFRRRFALDLAGEEANVVLVSPYYRESWSHGVREIDGLPVVSDEQLYLDLSTFPRRGPEQASRILERIVALEHAEAKP